MKRDFKGIWIPSEIWLDENMTVMEKFILADIDSLSGDKRKCFASNAHFARLTGSTPQASSQIIMSLFKKGFIDIIRDASNKRVLIPRHHNDLEKDSAKGSLEAKGILEDKAKLNLEPKEKLETPKEKLETHKRIKLETKKTSKKNTPEKEAILQESLCDLHKGHLTKFVSYRKEIGKKMTVGAVGLFARKLQKLDREGYCIETLLSNAIMNGWQTVYPQKEDKPDVSQGSMSW